MVYNCNPIPKVFGSSTVNPVADLPSDFQSLFEITNAPRAPVADNLKKSLLECFVFISIEYILLKILILNNIKGKKVKNKWKKEKRERQKLKISRRSRRFTQF